MEGIVIKSTGSWFIVLCDDDKDYKCKIKGKFKTKGIKSTNPVSVGDIVVFELIDETTGLIKEIKPRKNYMIRKSTNLSKLSHIIASNIDQAIIIVTISKPKTSLGFIDRFLVTAEAYHIPTIIVFNKIDIYDDKDKDLLETYKLLYKNIGYECISISAKENKNIEEFKSILKNKTSLISGHSGVGKSTIINQLEKNLNIKTGEISETHYKGTHTTTFAEMHKLEFGGYVIDTPGIKEFGIINLDKEDLWHRFPEMMEYINMCKFNNCTHTHEPNCKIIESVKRGEIAISRYESYLSILESMADESKYR